MRNGTQLIVLGLFMLGLTASLQWVTPTAEATVVVRKCRCGKSSCQECKPRRQKVRRRCRCPKCQTDVCELKAKCVKEERLCFEVEQKVICIPKISWPPTRCKCNNAPCCNDCDCKCRCKCRCGKTKTVKVLKASFRECPNCKYTWKVFEPELPQPIDPEDKSVDPITPSGDIEQPEFERNELYDPGGSDVPAPPSSNRINH